MKIYQVTKRGQLRFVLKNKDLKSKIRRINLKWILLNQLKGILCKLFRILQGEYQLMQLYLWVGFSVLLQTTFFCIFSDMIVQVWVTICASSQGLMIVGDNIYCLNVLLMNSDVYMSNVSNLCVKFCILQIHVAKLFWKKWFVFHHDKSRTPTLFKACICYFSSNFYFLPNDTSLITMKNVFYFI